MTYRRSLVVTGVFLALAAVGYMLAVRPGAAVQQKLTSRKGPRALPPGVKSRVEGLTIENVRFEEEYGDEMTVYDIVNHTSKAVLSVRVRVANSSVTLDADPGEILIAPYGRHVDRMLTDNMKDDTPLVLTAVTFDGEEVKGWEKDVGEMKELRRVKRSRMQKQKETGTKQ